MDDCILANIGIYFKTEYFQVSRKKIHSNNLQEAHVKKWWLQFYYASCYHILENQLNLDKIVSFGAWSFPTLDTICSHTADGVLQKSFYHFNSFPRLLYCSILFSVSYSCTPRQALALTHDGYNCFLVTLLHNLPL